MNKKDILYLDIAKRVGLESHAVRAKVGAVLVRDDNILAYGYNGTPRGMSNECEENTYLDHGDTVPIMQKTKREVLHAESNALAKVARSTNSSEGSTLYVTLSPCFDCAKLIVQAGVKKVVYDKKYRDVDSITFLIENGIEVEQA